MRPELSVHLVESRKLRIEWLERSLQLAGARNARVIGARLEGVPTELASVISARAFAPLTKLLRLADRFSTSDTLWLLPKGRSAAQEVSNLPPALQSMFHVEPSVTDADSGIVVGRIAKGGR
jgi:16S rRNA (guanine527-N7)-methyltransferase